MQNGNHGEAAPNPALVFDMLQAYQRTAALKAAVDLDLFRAIGEGNDTAASIAQYCRASERGARILCDFLVVNGILQKENGRYRHSPTSAVFLDPQSPACLASIAHFLADPALHTPSASLTEIVRSGRTSLPGEGSLDPEHPMWVQFAENMAPMMGPVAGPLAAAVLDGHDGPMHVLDIAAGHGLFGIAVAQQHKEAQVTGVDWAPVLRVALKNAEKAGVHDRYTMLPGSAFDVEFGGPYDVVLLTNFLHHFDKPTCVGLLTKIRGALKPGGKVATLEFVPNDDRVSPPMPAAFAMTMLLSTPSGEAYTFSEISAMYAEAGLSGVRAHPIPTSPQTVVIGRA
jgi:hypothetical protein